MKITITCRPNQDVYMLVNKEWMIVPRENVQHLAVQCDVLDKNTEDCQLKLEYHGEMPKIQYQYLRIWMEKQIPRKAWVSLPKSEWQRKPFYLQKRKVVVFPELIEAN